MKIKQIQIKNFGKLHQIDLRPRAGINVIYGENESGKSTLHQFITGMLFGLEKQRGKSGRNDVYQQYEPWNSSSFYAGSMQLDIGDKQFWLQRNFYHKEKSARLISEQDQEELSVVHGDLEMLLGGIKKDTFENTYCIGQAAVETKKEFSSILQNYFLNASFTGEAGIDLTAAKKKLKSHQKDVEQICKRMSEERMEKQEQLQLELRLVNRDISQLKEQQEQMQRGEYLPEMRVAEPVEEQLLPEYEKNQMAEYLQAERQQKKEGRYRRQKIAFLCLALLSLVMAGWQFISHGMKLQIAVGIVCAVVFLIGIVGAVYWKNRENHAHRICKEYENHWDEAKTFMAQHENSMTKQQDMEAITKQKAVSTMLESQLAEKKTRLMNLEEELEEYEQPTAQETERQQQLQAYQLSLDTLQKLSENIYKDSRGQLENAASDVIAGITGGKYTKMVLDDQMNLRVLDGNRMLYPWQLSRGTMEQVFVALRLGAGRIFSREESMPILLDEVFASFDEIRLERMLQWLAEQPEQIFLFTCQKREMEILEKNNLSYEKILLKIT